MRWLASLLLSIVSSTALATGQIPDTITIDGKNHALFANPLDPYLKMHGRPAIFEKGRFSSANWRGYVASWSIRDGRLFLEAVKLRFDFNAQDPESEWTVIPLHDVIPEATSPLFAHWYTGVLRIPQGEELMYVHMGYGSIYERELLISVKDGAVLQSVEVTNTLDEHSGCKATARELYSMVDASEGHIPALDLRAEIAKLESQCRASR